MRVASAFGLTAVVLVLFTGCGFERGPDEDVHAGPAEPEVLRAYPPDETPGGLPGTPHERFYGTWLIDQPYHATYEASFYTFAPDGVLTLEAEFSFSADRIVGVVSGHDEPCGEWGCDQWSEDAVFCSFGSAWSATDNATVHIEGVCDDEQTRTITLTFEGEPAGNSVGWGVETVDAQLEGYAATHSGHPGFEWRYKKCFDLDGSQLWNADEGWDCQQYAEWGDDEAP